MTNSNKRAALWLRAALALVLAVAVLHLTIGCEGDRTYHIVNSPPPIKCAEGCEAVKLCHLPPGHCEHHGEELGHEHDGGD